jgi:hypothetical protein
MIYMNDFLRGSSIVIPFPAEASDFSLLRSVQTDSGAYRVLFPGRKADHSPPSSAEVKNRGATSALPYVFMTLCLIN